jgi:hypothetical protein
MGGDESGLDFVKMPDLLQLMWLNSTLLILWHFKGMREMQTKMGEPEPFFWRTEGLAFLLPEPHHSRNESNIQTPPYLCSI